MPFKLSKKEETQRDELTAALRAALEKVNERVAAFNEVLQDHRDTVEAAVGEYNEALNDARSFCEEIASQAEADIDEKSDKWREGDKGSAAEAWKEEWENVDLEDLSVDSFPGDLEIDEPSHADDIEGLSTEMEA